MSDYSEGIWTLDTAPRSSVEVRSIARAMLPSFGAVVFAVSLLHVLFLSAGASGLFRDSDTGWHIRNGERILHTSTLPRTDPFSYSRNGEAWFAWEWLSDVALAESHAIAGLSGVAFVAAIAIALTIWFAARLSLSLGGDLLLTAGATVLMLGVTSIHWLARPHVLSWLMALVFLWIAERERREPGRASLYILPVIACLWANVHGSFLLGPAILFIYAVGERRIRRFGLACLGSLLATFINPYGWRLHDHVFTYLQNTYLMDRIAEFRSFSFHSEGALYVELFIIIAIAGALAMLRQRAFGPALLTLAMFHMSLYSARHLPTAAILVLPLTVAAITRELRTWPSLKRTLQYSERLRAIDARVWGAIPVMLVLAVSFAGLSAVDFSPEKFPARAVDFLEQHDGGAHVFAKDQWGGYLIYRFAGRSKVFVDGRSDFYGRDFLETYAQVAEVKPGWDAVLKHYDVRFVLIPPDHTLAAVLQLNPGWRQVYADPVATIFEKTNVMAVSPPGTGGVAAPKAQTGWSSVPDLGSTTTPSALRASTPPVPGGEN